MKKFVAYGLGAAFLVLPLVVSAQTPQFGYVNSWLNQAIYWLRLAITVVMILMTLYFLLSVFQFIRADASKKDEKKQQMIRGLVGLFVAVAVWGIIKIAGRIVGVDTQGTGVDTPIGITCPPGLHYVSASGTCER